MKLETKHYWMIGGVVLAGLAYMWYKNTQKDEKKSNASGLVGTQRCPSGMSGSVCEKKCTDVGGTYNPLNRVCSENAYSSKGTRIGSAR
jgi:hypothetical protein